MPKRCSLRVSGTQLTTCWATLLSAHSRLALPNSFENTKCRTKELVNSFYTHRLDKLLTISGVKSEMEIHTKTDSSFEIKWNTVRDWSETKRYEVGVTEVFARGMYDAVTNTASGILPWLKTQW